MGNKYKGPKVALVEGTTDLHVISALCNQFNVPTNFEINPCGGVDQALEELDSLILSTSPKIEIIGLIIDADKDYCNNPEQSFSNRWDEVKLILEKYKYDNLQDFPRISTFTQKNKPKIGIWLMPNNQNAGMLEDFLLDSILENHIKTAMDCVKKAKDDKITSFRNFHESKAIIHTYLSWLHKPGFVKTDSLINNFKHDSEISRRFVDWLKRLFEV